MKILPIGGSSLPPTALRVRLYLRGKWKSLKAMNHLGIQCKEMSPDCHLFKGAAHQEFLLHRAMPSVSE